MRTEIRECLLKTLTWLAINSFFGLAPLVIAGFLSIMKNSSGLSFTKIIEEGLILFFCAALCASAMVDYIMAEKKFEKIIEAIIYLAPSVLLFFTALVFTQLFSSEITPLERQSLLVFQNITIGFSFLYVFIIKTVVFHSETKSSA